MLTQRSHVTVSAQISLYTSFRWPSTARVVAVGEIDMASAAVLDDRLQTLLRDHELAVLDVDLAEVTFLDCAGISVLMRACGNAAGAGCIMYVSHPQPIVRRILDITSVLDVVTAPPWQAIPRPTSATASATATAAVKVASPSLVAVAA